MIRLIQRKRSTEFKGGNVNPEFVRIGKIHHVVVTLHRTNRGSQKAARAVGVLLTRTNYRFLAYDTFSVKHLKFIKGIKDLPMAGGQLHHILALVLNSNGITKSKVHFVILEEGPFKGSINRDLNALSNLCNHSALLLARGLKNFQFLSWLN